MKSLIKITLYSILGSSEQLTERLREVGDRLRLPLTARPGPLVPSIPGTSGSVTASQIEVGPSHFAFLLSDGRLCRLPFSVISDRLDLNKSSQASGGTGGSLGSHGGHGGSSGGGKGNGSKNSHSSSLSTGESFQRYKNEIIERLPILLNAFLLLFYSNGSI